MTTDKRIKSHAIIHTASVAAGGVGAGLAQIPVADSVPLSGIQVTMIVSLGSVFGMEITKSAAKAIVLAFAASYAGRSASQLAAGWIPGIGNAMNATTAVALTEAMGWHVARQFDKEKSPDEIIEDTKITTEEISRAIVENTPDSKLSKENNYKIDIPIFREEELEDVIIDADDIAISSEADKESQDGTLL